MEYDIKILIAGFLIAVSIRTIALYAGMRISGNHGSIVHLFLASGISALFGYIPFLGWLISLIVLLSLISYWTDAEIFPDAVLIVVISWGISMFIVLALLSRFS